MEVDLLFDWNWMDSELVKRGLDFTRRKKKWIVVMGLVGFSGYGVYKVYTMPSVVRKRRRLLNLIESLFSIVEMVSDSAEVVTVVSRDLKEFLNSDSDEIPNSLKQLSKLVRSEEFSESVARVSRAMTVGILRGYKVEGSSDEIKKGESVDFSEKVMDKLMSSAGTGFASVVVGSFARNLILGYVSGGGSGEGLYENGNVDASNGKSNSAIWISLISDERSRVLIADCIKTFVSTAVAVYLDKTMDINFYDDVFSGMTNPKHQQNVKDILVSLCNGAIETLVKTSHQVLTAPKQGHQSETIIDCDQVSSVERKMNLEHETHVKNDVNGSQDAGWVTSISSMLAVPSNRKFVLDVTGRVTFETVRSFVEFFLWKICDGLKRGMNVARVEVVEKGFEVVRYVGAKSYVLLTLCLALFLHICGNTKVMLPA